MDYYVTQEQISTARHVQPFEFMSYNYPNEIVADGPNAARLISNRSVTMKKGLELYMDWSGSQDQGNTIDLLMMLFGYDFVTAVTEICQHIPPSSSKVSTTSSKKTNQSPASALLLPPKADSFSRMYAYLIKTRKIKPEIINRLVYNGLIYQEADHSNIVFVNYTHTFAELRGSNSFVPFHQVQCAVPEDYWSFQADPSSDPDVAFVCEGAIDAISLYQLHQVNPPATNAMYCSIGGVANQQRIDKIKADMEEIEGKTIIAVDNDNAGAKCRERNQDCAAIIPTYKDWNEDVISMVKY